MNFSSKTHKNSRTWPPLPPKKSPNPQISQQTRTKTVAKISEPIVAKIEMKAETDELHCGQDRDEGRDRRASKFFFKIIIFVTLSTVRLPNPENEEQYPEIKI